jgi:hypothetical protein
LDVDRGFSDQPLSPCCRPACCLVIRAHLREALLIARKARPFLFFLRKARTLIPSYAACSFPALGPLYRTHTLHTLRCLLPFLSPLFFFREMTLDRLD